MRFLTLLLLAAPAAFAESPCGVDRRAIRCTKYPGADPEDPLREVYLAESTNATISICESIGQAACSCTQDGRMYCGLRSEARADNRLKFAAECRHDGDRSWKYEENQDCDLPGFQGVPGLDDFMSDDDDLEDEAA